MIKKFIFIFLILFSIYVSAETSVAVVPPTLDVTFEPNLNTGCDFMVKSNFKDAVIFKEGELSEYLEVPEERIVMEPGEWRGIPCMLKLPNDIEPGLHELFVGIKEYASPEAGVGAVAKISSIIFLRKPYPGKYLEGEFDAKWANINEDVKFTIKLVNRGTDNIGDVYADIKIYDAKETASITTNHISMEKTGELKATWKTDRPGNYNAEAIVYYDGGNSFDLKSWFNVGDLLVEITDVSKAVVKQGEIAKFNISVHSFWNTPIGGVYGELSLNDESITRESKTNTIELGALTDEIIPGFLETEGLKEGEYDVDIKVYYSNKTAEGKTKLTVKKKVALLTIVLITVIVILLILFILWYFLSKRKKRK